MIDLYDRLTHLGYKENEHFVLSAGDDGVPKIESWTHPTDEEPTKTALMAVAKADADAVREKIKLESRLNLSEGQLVILKWIDQKTGGDGDLRRIKQELGAIWKTM